MFPRTAENVKIGPVQLELGTEPPPALCYEKDLRVFFQVIIGEISLER